MRFSTRTTYGIRAMVKLAANQSQGSLSLARIAKDEDISLKYLESLFSRLKKAKLVTAAKGVSGGYVLARSAVKINLYEIITALEGKMALFHCLAGNDKINCSHRCGCSVVSVLDKVQNSIKQTLVKIKLSDLV